MHRRARSGRVLLIALVLVLLAAVLFKPALRRLFPIKYTETIVAAARHNELEPLLVAAVIQVESGFRDNAESAKGARGLMQIMPETGEWAAQQMRWDTFDVPMLFDPTTNVTVGTWYLRHLFNLFDDNLPVVLAAYNAGQNRVLGWLNEGRWDGRSETLEDVPFGETRTYVRRVLATFDTYRWLYEGEL